MKKLVSLSMAITMLLSAVSCSSKKTEDGGDTPTSAQTVEITQLMYKQEDIDLPEDMTYRLGLYYHDGIRLIYKNKENKVKVLCYGEDMKEASSFELTDGSEDFYETYCCTRPDGSITLLLMKVVSDDEPGSEEYFKNADVSFEIRTYSPDGEQLDSLESDGFGNYFSFGSSFILELVPYGERYIISFSEGLAIIDENGEVTDVKETSEHFTFGTDTEGNTLAGTWDNYNYLDGETLNYDPDTAPEYGKWVNLMGGIFTGTGDFKAYFVMNEGIYGLTYSDELIQVLDFSDSNITANGIRSACYGGDGKFVIMGDDQTTRSGIYYLLLTVRPDDYVENKQTVVLGCANNDNNGCDRHWRTYERRNA